MNKIRKLGRVGGGKSQSKTVYSVNGLCPTLSASMGEKGNTMPYIIVKQRFKTKGSDIECGKSRISR